MWTYNVNNVSATNDSILPTAITIFLYQGQGGLKINSNLILDLQSNLSANNLRTVKCSMRAI